MFITSGAVYTKKSDKTPVNQQNNDNNFNLQNSFQNSFLNEKVDFSDLQSEFDNLFWWILK